VVETRIYGIIGADVTSTSITDELAALDGTPDLTVRINSRGGDVFEGVAILNALRGYGGRVTTVIDGLAASAASFIAMSGAEIVMNRNSEMMIHNGHTLAIGGAEDMRKMADNLERVNANIASIYAERAGGTADDWRALMADETWFSAEEAVSAGLADRVESIKGQDANKVKAFFDLSIFNHAGRSHAPAPRIPQAHNETPRNPEAEKGKEATMATLSESALQKLGLDADADESAIDEAIEKLATPAESAPPAEPSIDEATKVAAKFGMTVVNSAQWDQAQAQLADLTARATAQTKAENESAITNALTTGRISAESADTWRGALAENREGTLSLLATLPANKAVPVDEIGHGVSREDQPEDEGKVHAYAQITGHDYGKGV
jgi:ATP-dependent protease ClpP protease subunit